MILFIDLVLIPLMAAAGALTIVWGVLGITEKDLFSRSFWRKSSHFAFTVFLLCVIAIHLISKI